MAQWTAYYLEPKPGVGFHFGLRGLEQESSGAHCPSDTVFGALVAALAELDGPGGVDAFTAPFERGQPPFLLTSAFPRAGNLLLLPVPFVRVEMAPFAGQSKLLKRLTYVSPRIFERIVRGLPLDTYAPAHDSQGLFLQHGVVWLADDERSLLPGSWGAAAGDDLRNRKVWDLDAVDRVAVDRVTSASAVYRTGRTIYAEECGLWLGVQWPGALDAAAEAQLDTLLRDLGDRGLGGDRSVGYGQFALRPVPMALSLPEARPDRAAITLSRYLPAASELPQALRGSAAAYRLAPVPGWLYSSGQRAQRRRQIRMLIEGGVFQAVGPGPWGRVADVRPNGWSSHPVWRYGYACAAGVAAQGVDDA